MSGRWRGELLERDSELSVVDAVLDRAAGGDGHAVVVEGPPGIGKSQLVAEALNRARERGFRILSAPGSEFEREFSFGVARQLFELPVAALSPEERSSVLAGAASLAAPIVGQEADAIGAPGDIFPFLHGLYWLTSGLSSMSPLLIAVDDAHWVDEPTLQWLHYLTRRLDGLRVAVIVASRSTAPEAPVPLVHAINLERTATLVCPGPLSELAASAVVAEVFAEQPEPMFNRACHETSGGNPFLLMELCGELARSGIRPLNETVATVRWVRSEAVARQVLGRLERMTGAARALAGAVAVFGSDVDLRLAATVGGLSTGEATDAADELMAAALLLPDYPLRYTHALVRAAVYGYLRVPQQAELHGRAAQALIEVGVPAERVAGHLLLAVPRGDPQAVKYLRRAAATASARGSLAAACRYLRRALAEPPSTEIRPQVLLDLAGAEAAAADPEAAARLPEAFAAATDPAMRADAFEHAAWFFLASGRTEQTLDLLNIVRAELSNDPSRELELEAQFVAAAMLDPNAIGFAVDRMSQVGEDLPGASQGERMMLCHLAYHRMWRSQDATRAVELAFRALADGQLLHERGVQPHEITGPIMALTCADELDAAAAVIDDAQTIAVARGSEHLFAFLSCMRAIHAYRSGNLAEAQAEAQASVEITVRSGLLLGAAVAGGWLVWTLVEQGEFDAAQGILDTVCPGGQVAPLAPFSILLAARGRLNVANGRVDDGVADLLECGRRNAVFDIRNPVFVPWRAEAVHALHLAGRLADAHALADENLAVATTWGTAGAIGAAYRVRALVADERAEAITDLEQAAACLRESPARLELARALLDLGAATRRSGRRSEARKYLGQSLDIATRCDAGVVAAQAELELRTSGARPRRTALTGVDALTPTETRVATLAAEGRTNSEIAQRLFVSSRTVETHLRNAYTKLEIRSRDQLIKALAG